MTDTAPTKNTLAEFVESFFAPVVAEMNDLSVSEILINGPREIYVERGGTLTRSGATFASAWELESALRAAAQFLGRSLDEQHPILEGRLPDGSRIQAVLSPLAMGGPCVAIRRHRLDALSFRQLIDWGSLNEEALDEIKRAVRAKKNILVSGGTGSGKTSLLRCIATLTPKAERIVTIEDARELHLSHEHVVSLEARPADQRGAGRISIGELFAATLRMRPDRIVIGELRGGEALDLIQAMTSGHGGCLSTIHASSPPDALRRLETLALYRGVELPLLALRAQVASAVDLIVQVDRISSGARRVTALSEVRPLASDGTYQVNRLMFRETPESELVRVES